MIQRKWMLDTVISTYNITLYLTYESQLETFSRLYNIFQLCQYWYTQFYSDWLIQVFIFLLWRSPSAAVHHHVSLQWYQVENYSLQLQILPYDPPVRNNDLGYHFYKLLPISIAHYKHTQYCHLHCYVDDML